MNVQTGKTRWLVITALVWIPILITLGGCDGTDIDDDDGYVSGHPAYPQYKNLTIALQVVDPAGRPIGDASVWVDGREDTRKTKSWLQILGQGWPRTWRNWRANWTSDRYRVVMNYPGDVDEFTIAAGKKGYWSDETRVRISDREPDEIFVRDVLVLEPRPTIYSAQAPDKPDREAEIVGADPDFVREEGREPQITIGDE
jgi:hypothetical protein